MALPRWLPHCCCGTCAKNAALTQWACLQRPAPWRKAVFFTRYTGVTDISNLLGHIYEVLAYTYLYRARLCRNRATALRPAALLANAIASHAGRPARPAAGAGRRRPLRGCTHLAHQQLCARDLLLGKTVRQLPAEHAGTTMQALAEARDTGISRGRVIAGARGQALV